MIEKRMLNRAALSLTVNVQVDEGGCVGNGPDDAVECCREQVIRCDVPGLWQVG